VAEAPPDSPGMATGETTVEFLRRLLPARGPARHAAGHSLSQRPDSTRDHLPHPAERGGRAPAGDCNAGRAEPPHGESDRLDQARIMRSRCAWKISRNRGHGRLHAAPSFPDADRHESASVSEAASPAGRARTHAHGWLDAASAAFEVGYESASQFNREYSRFFGQPPMRDVRTLRSPSAPALEANGDGATIAVVDLAAQKPLAPIELGALRAPHGLVMAGGKLYFTAEGAKVVGRYDPATQRIDWVLGTGQNRTHMVIVSKDLKTVFRTSVPRPSASSNLGRRRDPDLDGVR
jgi:AraC-like DNA-binding protein